ncbi:hypothetical protein LINGRAHAP2_LOCUS32018 [Linum grandiflorum]
MYNSNSLPIDGMARSTFCRAPICAEAAALLTTVRFAERSLLLTLILSDCAPLIASLNAPHHVWPWECAALIAAITDILKVSNWIDVRQCPRSSLRAADSIARKAPLGLLESNWLSYM